MCSKPARRKQAGLSMVELVMFIVIVGIAVVGVLQVLGMGARSSPDPMRRKQALAIAESMMEEVRLAHFTFCDGSDPKAEDPATLSEADCTIPEGMGPELAAGNVRPFDNVNDYGGIYTTDAAGNSFPTGYSAVVTVVQDSTFGAAGAVVPQAAALRITVVVTYGADNVTLDGYRARYAPRSL
ncbi:type IV pilus modification PilV family protein [Rugamonas aquatica]|uniref:Type II secretion system protein n=1 Tax=Rugamonas aquatica TaxID=2743357 RepID=A0A6A7N9K8_9BURK|nr:hypothetical protein [Rugamonas aquatica]MQA41790.1 hypothetical protein [Rugamonas aquatica]